MIISLGRLEIGRKTFLSYENISLININRLQCRRILGGRKLVHIRIVIGAIFHFMVEEDYGEYK